jgi:hypothetical protein
MADAKREFFMDLLDQFSHVGLGLENPIAS